MKLKESVWLRFIILYIHDSCQLTSVTDSPTMIYKDNDAFIAQDRGEFIKGDKTKHI